MADGRLDRLTRRDGSGPGTLREAVGDLFSSFWFSSPVATTGAVHIRDGSNTQALLNTLIVATLPCWLIGNWNLGLQTNVAMQQFGLASAPGWRGTAMELLGVPYAPDDILACFTHGLLYFVPILLVALAVGGACELLLASQRKRPVDQGMLSIAWIFALILPATVAPWQVALGMAVAILFGKGIFGGTGRYLVNPSVLGLAVLVFSYSGVIYGEGAWIPVAGYDDPTTIELIVDEGGVAALTALGYSWWELFLGLQPGPVGVTSPLGCLLGALYLLALGWVSWRIMLGSLVGLIGAVLILNTLGPAGDPVFDVPWHWHVLIGGWAFTTAFIATDPAAAAMTNPGRWAFGLLVGSLTIVVRLTNPAYYEGAIFAVLLASVFAPLIDHAAIAVNVRRRRRRLGSPS